MLAILRVTSALPRIGIFFNALNKRRYTTHFFNSVNCFLERENRVIGIKRLLSNEIRLKRLFIEHLKINHQSDGYLGNLFIKQLNAYATESPESIEKYLRGDQDINVLCKNFAVFCFDQNLKLNKKRILTSLDYHNSLSDKAIKNKILALPYQKTT